MSASYFREDAPDLVRPVGVILDNDFAGDVDGVVALGVLIRLSRLGECTILGLTATNPVQYEAPLARAICTHYGLSGSLPIGANLSGGPGGATTYDQTVVDEFGSILGDVRANYPSAVSVLRTLLAAAADCSVVLVCAGGLMNISALLASSSDGTSVLAGPELCALKLRRIIMMGGDYPSAAAGTGNWSFNAEFAAAAWYVFQALPISIEVFVVGYTTGTNVLSGLPASVSAATNPIRLALETWAAANLWALPTGYRASWDALAVLAGVRGTYGGRYFQTALRNGRIMVAADGSMTVDPLLDYKHTMLVNTVSNSAQAEELNRLLYQLGDS